MPIGLALALLQFCFVCTWTVYVAFLPALLAQAGLAPSWLPLLLMADQAVFVLGDLAAGVAADRTTATLQRLGPAMVAATVVSTLAFLTLPFAAGAGAAPLLLVATVVWALSSAALRAPVAALLAKRAAKPELPRLLAWWTLGLGLASALAPWLTVQLRGLDPRLPFALASLALALAALALLRIERQLPAPAPAGAEAQAHFTPALAAFLLAAGLLALGFQVHAQVNAAPLYLRFAVPAELPGWLSLYWVGFSLAMLPAGRATQRWGAATVLWLGAGAAAAGSALAATAGAMPVLAVAQLLSGAAWAAVMMSAWTAAALFGRAGREGLSGAAWSAWLALAALARIAAVAAHWPQQPAFKATLPWAPATLWALAAGLLWLAAQAARPSGEQAGQVERQV